MTPLTLAVCAVAAVHISRAPMVRAAAGLLVVCALAVLLVQEAAGRLLP